LSVIRDNVTESNYDALFKNLVPLRVENNTLVLQAPTDFIVDYIESTFLDLMRMVLRKELGATAKLEWVTLTLGKPSQPHPMTEGAAPVNKLPTARLHPQGSFNPFVLPGIEDRKIDTQLNPRYSFDNYIEGECNRLARSAGLAIAKNPGRAEFSPIFIHGGTGLGKTHLAHAIGLETKKLHPEKTVLYLSAHKFQEQFTRSLHDNDINDFLHFYQMIDVLILDDVHDFAHKEKTQDVFFHIFEHLYRMQKQLIFTADMSPVNLKDFNPRILSRFKWGLIAELAPPDYETRLKIFKHKIHQEGIKLSDEIVDFLAEKIKSNVREFEGVLHTILAETTFNKQMLTMEFIEDVINKNIKIIKRDFTIDYIYKTVCNYYNVAVEDLQSTNRKRELVQARQVAMYFCKELTPASLALIGTHIGGKNHATVLHACKTISNQKTTNRAFLETLGEIEKKIKAM
jgi:chromosomal replication initiator protein